MRYRRPLMKQLWELINNKTKKSKDKRSLKKMRKDLRNMRTKAGKYKRLLKKRSWESSSNKAK